MVPLCLTAGGVIIFLYVFDYLSESIAFIKQFTEGTGIDNELIRTVFKIIGIGFLVEITAGSVKELGFGGVADKLIICGKIILFVAAIPILSSTYKIIVSLINLA
jgi:stage III sporulation protein AD